MGFSRQEYWRHFPVPCVTERKQKKWGRSRQSFSGQGTQRGFWRTGNFFFLTLTLNPLEDPLNYDVHFLVITACVCVCAQSLSHAQLFANLWTVDCQAPLSMGFPRQEYWSGLPFVPPGDLPDPGIEPGSPALQADSLPKGEFNTMKHAFYKRFFVSHEDLMSPGRDLVLL